MSISNAEKQARFRKKEQLSKHVSQVARDCQLIAASKPYLQRAFRDLDTQLRKAASLPSGWNDDDLLRAHTRVRNIHGDILGAVDQLRADIQEARDSLDAFKTSPHPRRWLDDTNKAERGTIALASHLVSALNLSQLPNEEQAAALMEAVRHVGRALASSNSIGQSAATAACLASANPHYARPDWFVDRLASWLRLRLDDDSRKALGERLMQDEGGIAR
ncbi:MAG: hypothetical protein R3F21_18520 [Myxococcota bacterium]